MRQQTNLACKTDQVSLVKQTVNSISCVCGKRNQVYFKHVTCATDVDKTTAKAEGSDFHRSVWAPKRKQHKNMWIHSVWFPFFFYKRQHFGSLLTGMGVTSLKSAGLDYYVLVRRGRLTSCEGRRKRTPTDYLLYWCVLCNYFYYPINLFVYKYIHDTWVNLQRVIASCPPPHTEKSRGPDTSASCR